MNWFLAKIVFRIICGEGDHTPQFDEQLRLIHAMSAEAAYQKAKQIGKQEQHDFLNQHQRLVQWQFVSVSEMYPLLDEMDGAEVFSRIVEIHASNEYIRETEEKSGRLVMPLNVACPLQACE